jgi:hypothetical protein
METERKTLRKVGKKEIKAEEDEDEDGAIGEPTHASSN